MRWSSYLPRTSKSIRAGQWREFKQKAYRRRMRRLVLALPNQSQTPDEYETRHDKGKPMAAPENKLLQHAEGISDDGKNMLHKVVRLPAILERSDMVHQRESSRSYSRLPRVWVGGHGIPSRN